MAFHKCCHAAKSWPNTPLTQFHCLCPSTVRYSRLTVTVLGPRLLVAASPAASLIQVARRQSCHSPFGLSPSIHVLTRCTSRLLPQAIKDPCCSEIGRLRATPPSRVVLVPFAPRKQQQETLRLGISASPSAVLRQVSTRRWLFMAPRSLSLMGLCPTHTYS